MVNSSLFSVPQCLRERKKTQTLLLFLLLLLAGPVQADRPNVVLIRIDDLSHYGVTAYGANRISEWFGKFTEWDAMDKGPRRDIVAELERSIRKRGLKYLTSFHHHWKWGWYASPITGADCLDPRCQQLYGPPLPASAWKFDEPSPAPDAAFSEAWLRKVNEVVDNYHPDLTWEQSESGLHVKLPLRAPDRHAFVLRLTGHNLTRQEEPESLPKIERD